MSDQMNDHEQIEELLAGYSLRALEGDDATQAEGLLANHVPSCASCKQMLTDFEALTGDLALAADPVTPPDLLWPMIKRSMGDKRRRNRRPWVAGAVAASMVAVFAMTGWNLVLNDRVADVQGDKSRLTAMFKDLSGDDGRRMVTLRNDERDPTMLATYLPGQPYARLGGVNVPPPAEGAMYRVWLISPTSSSPIGSFEPDQDGYVMLELPVDLTQYEEIVVSEEPITIDGAAAAVPGTEAQVIRWRALIYPS